MAAAPLTTVIRHIRNLVADRELGEQTDRELLRAFLSSNDQTAFATLVRRHGRMVLRVCLAGLGNAHDAEDALQATFLVLARQAASIRRQESLASWLHGVAYRMATHAKRAAARRHKYESRANPAQPSDPALCAAWKELQVLLDKEIECLPATLRAPFVCCCLENKSCAEAARWLGLKESTVCVRLSRARKLLQGRLTRRGVALATVLAGTAVGASGAVAAVPKAVVRPIVKAAAEIAAGKALRSGPVSVQVITLVEGVTQAMFFTKCKTVILLLVSIAIAGLGLGVAALHGASAQPPPLAQHASQGVANDGPKKDKEQPVDPPAEAKEIVKAGVQPEIPWEVHRALQKNAHALAPIALTLKKQRIAPEPPSELTKALLGTFPGILKPCTYEYLSQDGLCYARYNQWVQGGRRIPGTDDFTKELMETWQEFSWDGKSAYLGAQSLQPQILSIVPIEKVASDDHFKIVTWYDADDYFGMTGITVPRTMPDLPDGPRSEILRMLEGDGRVTAARPERLAGTEQFVVELLSGGKKHRFWLDPSLGHAVRRHEVWADSGAIAIVIENSDFVKLTDPALWLPRHCHSEWHIWPWVSEKPSREPAMVVTIQVTRLERIHVPPEKFTLKYDKPGTYISDARLPGAEKSKSGRIDYIVTAEPANRKDAVWAGQQDGSSLPPRRYLFLWILGAMIVLGAVAAALVLIRRRRQRGQAP